MRTCVLFLSLLVLLMPERPARADGAYGGRAEATLSFRPHMGDTFLFLAELRRSDGWTESAGAEHVSHACVGFGGESEGFGFAGCFGPLLLDSPLERGTYVYGSVSAYRQGERISVEASASIWNTFKDDGFSFIDARSRMAWKFADDGHMTLGINADLRRRSRSHPDRNPDAYGSAFRIGPDLGFVFGHRPAWDLRVGLDFGGGIDAPEYGARLSLRLIFE